MKQIKKDKDVTLWVSIVMAAVLFFPIYGQMLTSCMRTNATPVAEEPEPLWSWDGEVEWIGGAAETLWQVAWEIQDCPALMDTIRKNEHWTKLYNHMMEYDCIECGGILCLELSKLDVWDDTLGEIPEADDLKDDLLYLLCADHIYECK